MEHHTKSKGDLGVLKAQLDLYLKGFVICLPMTEHAPFDLVICKDGTCKSVQVKTRSINSLGQVALSFSNTYSDSKGSHKIPVNKDLIDIYCIYVPEKDCCYYLNPKDFDKSISLRVNPPKNNQNKGVKFLQDFKTIPV